MANPFGELVDDEKLEEMARYVGKVKTQEDRAREAMRAKDGVGGDEARKYVNGVKAFYGDGASTLCMFYNATGDTLYFVDDHDWNGHVSRTPYPTEIGNGQWVSFLHVHETAAAVGSEAAVIYRGKQKDGLGRDFMVSWSTPWGAWYNNKAYCEMREVGQSTGWGDIYGRLQDSSYDDKVDRDGMLLTVSTASGTSPMLTAVFTIPGAA